MRKIEQKMIAAIQAGRNFSLDNTVVTVNTREDGAKITSVYLHGNLIAQNGKDGEWGFCLCGWNTPTTRSRLNAVLTAIGENNFRFIQKKHKAVLALFGVVPEYAPFAKPMNVYREILENDWVFLK